MDKEALNFIDLLALKPNIKKDNIELFIQNTGHQQINEEAQYQNVQIQIEEQRFQQNDDFYVQQQQETTDNKGIKTKQFWKAIMSPDGAPKSFKKEINYQIKHVFSYGFNSLGRDTIILIDGCLCKAIGCMLILRENIYLKHNYTITSLSLNHKTNQVLSGTQGISPQLVLWNYEKQTKKLLFVKKFFLGRRAESISMLSFFKNQFVFAIQKVSIHKSSCLHLFNKSTDKKFSLKIGKCYDLEILQNQQKDDRIFIANQKGISELQVTTSQEFQLKEFIQCSNITAFQPIQTKEALDIIYGDRQGKVYLHNAKKQIKVHNGWIIEIKVCQFTKKLEQSIVITLGAQDNKMAVLSIKNNQITIFRQFLMSGYVRSLFPQKDKILLGCRDGTIQQYNLLNILNRQNKKQQCLQFSSVGYDNFVSKPQTKHFFEYIRHFKKYVYGKNDSKILYFISGIQSNKKENYILRECPQSLSVYGNLVAYTYDIYKPIQNKSINASQVLNKKNKKQTNEFYKSILVIQDYVQNKLKLKADISFLSSQNKQTMFKKCCKVKWSQERFNLALGFATGQLIVINYENVKEVQNNLIFDFKTQKDFHQEEIQQIIWSNDNKYIKSVSTSQVMYWQLQKINKYEVNLKNTSNRNVKNTLWTQIGKFSWQSKQVWEKVSLISDLVAISAHQIIKTQKTSNKEIQSEKERLIVCQYDTGILQIYNSPAQKSSFKEYKLISNSSFQIIPNYLSKEQITFWLLYEGALCLFKLAKC